MSRRKPSKRPSVGERVIAPFRDLASRMVRAVTDAAAEAISAHLAKGPPQPHTPRDPQTSAPAQPLSSLGAAQKPVVISPASAAAEAQVRSGEKRPNLVDMPSPIARAPWSSQSLAVNTTVAEPISSATTDGIRVTVRSIYLADQSSPEDDRYVFAYAVAIENVGDLPAKLETRHWIITDGVGGIEEVAGDGVVGEQPRLDPGGEFRYTSGCVLNTPIGSMHGTYQMTRDDGSRFDAVIAPFSLVRPTTENRDFN